MQCIQYCSPICIVVNVHVSVDMNYAPFFVIYVYCWNVRHIQNLQHRISAGYHACHNYPYIVICTPDSL